MNLSQRVDALLERVEKPVRYMGGEFGCTVKDPSSVDVRYAFLFPDTYEVGMSHLGMKILYHAINAREDALCERVFSPWVDMAALMRAENVPLFTLESRTPVREFDLLGITLQYEMSSSKHPRSAESGRHTAAQRRAHLRPLRRLRRPLRLQPRAARALCRSVRARRRRSFHPPDHRRLQTVEGLGPAARGIPAHGGAYPRRLCALVLRCKLPCRRHHCRYRAKGRHRRAPNGLQGAGQRPDLRRVPGKTHRALRRGRARPHHAGDLSRLHARLPFLPSRHDLPPRARALHGEAARTGRKAGARHGL